MCSICDGETFEEYIAGARLRIAVYGYMMCGVNDEYVYPWVYTAGLLDAVGHPELIIASASLETNALICNAVSETIMSGDRFAIGETLRIAGKRVRIGAVADVQYELDTFNMWHELRDAGVLTAPRLSAVQVVVEDGRRRRRNVQPMLSDPQARVGARRLRGL